MMLCKTNNIVGVIAQKDANVEDPDLMIYLAAVLLAKSSKYYKCQIILKWWFCKVVIDLE